MVVWVVVPLLPVIVSVDVPLWALFAALIVKVDVPEVVIDAGLKVPVTRFGKPLTVRVTVPVNPFCAPMVTVYLPVLPRLTVRLAGVALIVKFGGGGGAVTTRVTVVECNNAPSAPVSVRV